jgi:hypothetical protein
MKVVFVMLLVVNVVALYAGVVPFFVTFAQVGEPAAYYQGIEAMREFLWPSLKWLVGVAIANLVFAAIAVLRCGGTTT